MESKERIKRWLLENCLDKFGNLDLSELDFSDFDGEVLLFNMKVKENLYQYGQEVSGELFQSNQKVKRSLHQDYQEVKDSLYQDNQQVGGSLRQDYQKVQGDLYQDDQKVEGAIFQDNITNADIDEKINALKEIISELEKQKVVDAEKCAISDCSIKLGQLEDIEKELGIDLITFFKVISQGYIFVEEQNTEEKEIVAEYIEPNFLKHTFDFKEPRKEIGKGRPFSRIGKTWALTKEELE